MTAQQLLDNFLCNHPDFWNFNEELKEVERLKKAYEIEKRTEEFSFCT